MRNLSDHDGLEGDKSSKSGSGSSTANTIKSSARVRVVDVLSEGPIQGLVNGAKSIYINDVALQNADGTYNFEDVTWGFKPGMADDVEVSAQSIWTTALGGPAGVETVIPVGIAVTNAGGGITRTVSEPLATSVRVIIRVDALFLVDADSGETKTNSMTYTIKVRPTGAGSWSVTKTKNLTDEKLMSSVQFEHVINLPSVGTATSWDILVQKSSSDSADANNQKTMSWDAYSVLVDGNFSYPWSAAVAMEMNAEQIGSSVPPRTYEVYGRKVQVPDVYNATTRSYSGPWLTGNFITAWTDNPAWIYWDLVNNPIFSIGDLLEVTDTDKWKLFAISQYCDQMVPSGFKDSGGADILEPRYTFNGVISDRKEAFDAIRDITRTWRGMAYWSKSQMFTSADMPSDPVHLLSPANVDGGAFKYSTTSKRSRCSVVVVRWNDPAAGYKPARETYVDDDQVRKLGWRVRQVDLPGCTSRGLARRYAKWIIETEKSEAETVTFSAGLDQVNAVPGEVISIADPRRAMIGIGGRIVSHEGDTLKIDRAFVPGDGATYSVMVSLPDGSVATYPVLSFHDSDTTLLRLGAVVDYAEPNAMFVIVGSDIQPTQWRIVSVEEASAMKFSFTATYHDPTKYARVEQGINLDAAPLTRATSSSAAPGNLQVREVSYVKNGVNTTTLTLSWTPPPNVLVKNYSISADSPTRVGLLLGQTSNPTFDYDVSEPGAWTFYVTTTDITNVTSSAVTYAYTVTGATAIAGGQVQSLVEGSTNSSGTATFSGQDVRIAWKNVFPTTSASGVSGTTATDEISPLYAYNTIKIYTSDTSTLLRTVKLTGGQTNYTYDNASMTADALAIGRSSPVRAIRFEVTVTDTQNRTSSAANLAVSNPVPALLTPTIQIDGNYIVVTWGAVGDHDYVGTEIWIETNNSFNPYATAPKYDGPNNTFRFQGASSTTYYVRVGAYDVFGRTGLNICTAITAVTNTPLDVTPPAVPTGLALASAVTGTGEAKITATWNANVEADFSYYDVRIKQSAGNYVSYQTGTNRYEFPKALTNTSYSVSVRAIDKLGNPSAYCTDVTHTTAQDTTPPAVPGVFSATGSFQCVWLVMSARNSEADFAYYEIYETASAGDTPVLATTATYRMMSEAMVREGFPSAATTRYYFARAVDTSNNKSAWTAQKTATTISLASTDLTGLVSAATFATGVEPVTIITSGGLPTAKSTTYIQWSGILYKWSGSAYVTVVNTTDLTGVIGTTQIADDAISTPKLQANSITASKLIVSDTTNLTPAPDFGDADAWTFAVGTSRVIAPSTSWAAPYIVQITDGAGTQRSMPGKSFAVNAGSTYYISAQLQIIAGTGTMTAQLQFSDTEDFSGTIVSNALSSVGTSVTTVAGSFVPAAGMRFGRVRLLKGTGITDSYAGAPIVRLAASAELIVDGAITATKISAGAVSASAIAAGAVTATKVSIGDTSNIFIDPMLVDLAVWTPTGMTISNYGLGAAISGSGASTNFLAIYAGGLGSVSSLTMPCETGKTYWFSCKLNRNGAGTGSITASVDFFSDLAGTVSLSSTVIGTHAANSWATYTTSTVAPVGALCMRWKTAQTVSGSTSNVRFSEPIIRRSVSGELIVDGSITGASLSISSGAIITGTTQIADGIITTAKITDLTANKITVPASGGINSSIQIGSSGVTLGGVTDPAALVNANTTLISPGKIQLTGSTALSSWLYGGDNTLIEGGAIAANTIAANKLQVGQRGITIESLTFEANSPTANKVSWTAGVIRYINDAGTQTSASITASSATWTTGNLYVYWVKGATTLSTTTTSATAYGTNNVVVAIYKGGLDLSTNVGMTIIDGSEIKTGSITADRLNATSIGVSGLAIFGGTLQSTNYVANTSGWRITNAGAAEFNSLQVRADMIVDNAVSSNFYSYKWATTTVTATTVATAQVIGHSSVTVAFATRVGPTSHPDNPVTIEVAGEVYKGTATTLYVILQRYNGTSWVLHDTMGSFTLTTTEERKFIRCFDTLDYAGSLIVDGQYRFAVYVNSGTGYIQNFSAVMRQMNK